MGSVIGRDDTLGALVSMKSLRVTYDWQVDFTTSARSIPDSSCSSLEGIL